MNSRSHTIDIFNPFKSLWHWLMAAPGPAQPFVRSGEPSAAHCTHVMRHTASQIASRVVNPVHVRRPLRMVRVMEAGQTSSQVGRMVISGRMADVCAELDRLAAFETQLH